MKSFENAFESSSCAVSCDGAKQGILAIIDELMHTLDDLKDDLPERK
jgi:hypothetical protein